MTTVGIDARAAAEERGGRGRYVRELLRALAATDDDHRYVLYARRRWDCSELEPSRFTWKLSPLPDPVWHLWAAVAARRCDAYLSTNSYLTAWFTRVPTILVVYDLITYVPAYRPQRRAALIERLTLPLAARRAARAICISQATLVDLGARFPRLAQRSSAIPLAANAPAAADGEAGVGRPFVLSVGTLEPRKNLVRLVEAFASLPETIRGDHVLALTGMEGWDTAASNAALERHAALVRPLGYVSERRLASLYAGATLVAYPSLYEGFGLPVLEAMQAGTPVLTSNVSSLPEVAGDAAFYVDPYSVESIAAGLAAALADAPRRAELGQRGRERARLFSWRRTAQETVAVIDSVTAG